MLCPHCKGAVCRRSRRRGNRDRIAGVAGLLPWRCQTCQTRFLARTVAVAHAGLVHCPKCGNLDLEHCGRDRVFGGWSKVQRFLRFPAYRCDACRERFFSLRRFKPIVPTSHPEYFDAQPASAVVGVAPEEVAVEVENVRSEPAA